MKELFDAAFSAVNIIPTILLMFVVVYWLLVILGALDLSAFDFDLDADTDVGYDAEMDATADVSVSWFNHVLTFFNIDKIPLMVFITFWSMPVWVVSVTVNDFFGIESFLLSLIILLVNLIVCLFIAKPLTRPFIKLFKALGREEETSEAILGSVGRVVIKASESKMGQGEVMIEGANFRLNIKTKKGEILKGQKMLVVNYIKDKNCYLVESYETID